MNYDNLSRGIQPVQNKCRWLSRIALAIVLLLAYAQTANAVDRDGHSDIAFHRPGSTWATVPVLFANGDGAWNATNQGAPFVNQAGTVAISGDYNGDGRSDIAFHKPGSSWDTVPILFSNGDGSWNATNRTALYANQPGVVAVPGDYNSDGRADIAFHKPGSTWATVPILFSNGDGTWNAANQGAPYANQVATVAVPGDYNNDGRTDIAFHKPGSTWATVPILFSNGDGTWNATNQNAPYANQLAAVAIPGDYNNDGRTDIALHKPGSTWTTVPILFSNGDGSWNATNQGAPYANQLATIAIPGDYNNDGRSDIAFHKPGSTWATVPILFSNGDGSWNATNQSALYANQPGVVAIPGDYNRDGRADIAFHRPGSTWATVPILFSNGNGSWNLTNRSAPYANQPGVVAIPDAPGHVSIAYIPLLCRH